MNASIHPPTYPRWHFPRSRSVVVLAVGVMVSVALTGRPAPATATTPYSSTIHVAGTSAPAGFGTPKGQWLRITRADGKTQLAVVFRPGTSGLHPLIVVLHGASGLAGVQLTWAANLARKGYIVMAGCYLNALEGAPPRTYVPCPNLADFTTASAAAIRKSYTTLLDAASTLNGAKAHATAVIAMSYGANVALDDNDPRVKAIVADSGYRDISGTTRCPVLLFGFIGDPNVPHAKLVAFELAQHKAGQSIESHFYPGVSHVALLTPATTSDATSHTTAFLRKHVG